ncbi:MAG: hypothetical protein AABY13_04500, partial [Nanoarchaeota archaeon]
GTAALLLPGILLSFVIMRTATLAMRAASAIVLGLCTIILVGSVLAFLDSMTVVNVLIALSVLSFVFMIVLVRSRRSIGIISEPHQWAVLALAAAGVLWRTFLFWIAEVKGDAFGYAPHIIMKSLAERHSWLIKVPNLSFYTGMVKDHAKYIGGEILHLVWDATALDTRVMPLVLALFTAATILLTYHVVRRYTQRTGLAFVAAAVMAIGPAEIWQLTYTFWAHPLAMIVLLLLFITFIEDSAAYRWLTGIVCVATLLSYYTASIMIVVLCAGFIVATMTRRLIARRSRVLTANTAFFLCMLFLGLLFVYGIADMSKYTTQNIVALKTTVAKATPATVERPPTGYVTPANVRIGNISFLWIEERLLLLCGLTFFIYLLVARPVLRDMNILLALIPACMLSVAFHVVHMPDRAYDYFAWLAIAALRLPKRILLPCCIILLLFFAGSVTYRADSFPFLTYPDAERDAAAWIKLNINGTVFSDETFANVLIQRNFFNVRGMADTDMRNIPVYFKDNPREAFATLRAFNATYIVITRRMQEQYILGVNFPQRPMNNSQMYEDEFPKVFDNGDTRIYKVQLR